MSFSEISLSGNHHSHRAIFLLTISAHLTISLLLGNVSLGKGTFLVQLSDGLAFPLGILFGVPAALGIAVSVFTTDAIRVAITLQTLVESLSLFLLAYMGRELWGRNPSVSLENNDFATARTWISIAITAIPSCIVAASILAWGYEIFGLFPFFISFLSATLSYLVSTLLLAPPIIYAVHRMDTPSWLDVSLPVERPSEDSSTFRYVVLVSGLWAILGVVGSIGFTIRQKIPRRFFRYANVELLYESIHPDIFGQGGRRVQILFGAIMIVVGFFAARTRQDG